MLWTIKAGPSEIGNLREDKLLQGSPGRYILSFNMSNLLKFHRRGDAIISGVWPWHVLCGFQPAGVVEEHCYRRAE